MAELFHILDRTVMRLQNGPVNRTFSNGTFTVIDVWNDVVMQGTSTTASTVTNSLTFAKAGFYEVTFGFNCSFQGQEELAVYAYVNGIQDTSGFVTIQGAGSGRPVELWWSPVIAVQAGWVVDLRATNIDSGSVEVAFNNAQYRSLFAGDIP